MTRGRLARIGRAVLLPATTDAVPVRLRTPADVLALLEAEATGGTVFAFVVMDTPLRQAQARAVALDRQLLAADRFQGGWDRRERTLDARAAEAVRVEAGLAGGSGHLAGREHEFDRKAVGYAEPEAENRLLRSELKIHTLHTAYTADAEGWTTASPTGIPPRRRCSATPGTRSWARSVSIGSPADVADSRRRQPARGRGRERRAMC